MLVDVAEHHVVFQKRGERIAGARHLESSVDRVGEIAGVAEHVAGRQARGVRHGEGRKQRVAVAQAHPFAGDRRHGRRGRVVDHAGAQAVGDEQHDVVRLWCLGESAGRERGRQQCRAENKQRTHGAAPELEGSPFCRDRVTPM
jgi:hypothetical protein